MSTQRSGAAMPPGPAGVPQRGRSADDVLALLSSPQIQQPIEHSSACAGQQQQQQQQQPVPVRQPLGGGLAPAFQHSSEPGILGMQGLLPSPATQQPWHPPSVQQQQQQQQQQPWQVSAPVMPVSQANSTGEAAPWAADHACSCYPAQQPGVQPAVGATAATQHPAPPVPVSMEAGVGERTAMASLNALQVPTEAPEPARHAPLPGPRRKADGPRASKQAVLVSLTEFAVPPPNGARFCFDMHWQRPVQWRMLYLC